jgi:hypothetical protein
MITGLLHSNTARFCSSYTRFVYWFTHLTEVAHDFVFQANFLAQVTTASSQILHSSQYTVRLEFEFY